MSTDGLLAAYSTVAASAFAGCSALVSERRPAGNSRLTNDDLPHGMEGRVTDVGSRPGEVATTVAGDVSVPPAGRRLSAATSLEPGASHTYESVFTEPVWYAVQFAVDGREPDSGATIFDPVPPDRDTGRYLSGTVSGSGEFAWGIHSTPDAGQFSPGGESGE